MTNLAIPILLVSIVMIAGVFAFMPLDKASTVHTTIATNIDDQNRAMTFAINMTSEHGQLLLIPGETGVTLSGNYVLSAKPASLVGLECGLTDGGTGKVSGTNASATAAASGALAALGSGEGISMQVKGAVSGVCQATIIIDSFADG